MDRSLGRRNVYVLALRLKLPLENETVFSRPLFWAVLSDPEGGTVQGLQVAVSSFAT